uniref:Reverse transcriptase domain-containing protein n=1 Tax=Haemonchus contortus TaxID=6289 RepID=A0A7I4Z643_HAECO
MIRGKPPGKDGITVRLLQACGPPLYRALARRYSLPGGMYASNGVEAVFDGAAVQEWRQRRSRTIVLSRFCQYFVKYSHVVCILARIRRTLEEAQPVEQAGFRQSFSTLDHIATCRRLIEASHEHRLPLVTTFIDYKKAFDPVEPVKVWEALEEQGERIYVDVIRECYSDCTTVFHPFYKEHGKEIRYR